MSASISPLDWAAHRKHRRSYEQMVSGLWDQNSIIGGDFNEPKYLLPWLRVPHYLEHRTGSLCNPTWRWNGSARMLASANYGHLLWTNDGDLTLREFKVLPRQPSDHAPLLGIFEVAAGKT